MNPVQNNGGHRQRLRQRFMRSPMAIEDYELLELLLFYGVARKDTKPLAKALLKRFGSLRAVLEAPVEILQEMDEFGEGLGTFWQVMREVRSRMAIQELGEQDLMSSPRMVARVARERLAGCRHEECWLALVNARNALQDWLPVQRGSVHDVHVDPAEILRMALTRKASGIILVHNHPGSTAKPSKADVDVTNELRELAPKLGVRFLDHVIVSDGESYSMGLDKTV